MSGDKYPPFSKKSEGYKRMVELPEEGTLSSDMPSKVAYQKDNVFLKYKPEAFRAGLNKYKTERGFDIRGATATEEAEEKTHDDDGGEDKTKEKIGLSVATSGCLKDGLQKLRSSGVHSCEMVIKKDSSNMGSEMSQNSTSSNWTPIHLKATFKDSILREQIGVVVVITSGVMEKVDVTANVEEDGSAVCIKTRVPRPVMDLNVFLLFSRVPKYQAQMMPGNDFRVRAFHEAKAKQRAVMVASIWRDFVLLLEFPVAEDIPIIEFLTISGTYYLYIELVAKERTSYMDNNGQLSGNVLDLNKAMAMLKKEF